MTLVEAFLVAMALILVGGLSLLILLACDLRANQDRGDAAILQYRRIWANAVITSWSIAVATCGFLDSVRRGSIPRPRRDY